MALFSRKKEEKAAEKPVAEKSSPVKAVNEIKKPAGGRKIVKKEFTNAYRILRRPLVTEKSVNLSASRNQYAFEISPSATKNEVKKTVQDLYGVRVLRVNVSNTRGKKRRLGGHEGWKPGFKKAIVFLAEGEKIEVIAR